MEIPIPLKTVFILRRGPGSLPLWYWIDFSIFYHFSTLGLRRWFKWFLEENKHPGPCFNIKTVFSAIGIHITEIIWSQDHLILRMGIRILVRGHFYFETDTCYPECMKSDVSESGQWVEYRLESRDILKVGVRLCLCLGLRHRQHPNFNNGYDNDIPMNIYIYPNSIAVMSLQ